VPARNPDDHAIVVGINEYLNQDLPELVGAHADATDFESWLVDQGPLGGGCDSAKVEKIVGSKARDEPTAARICAAFKKVAAKQAPGTRVGRRLWVFMSGHGAQQDARVQDVGILPAAYQSDTDNFFVVANLYVEALMKRGAFSELILLMDCCRDLLPLPLTHFPLAIDVADPAGLPNANIVTGYAAQYGAKAREREFDDITDPVKHRGIFTRALLEGLMGWAVDDSGEITKGALERYLRARVPYYQVKNRPQVPSLDGPSDLVLTNGTHLQKPSKLVLRFTGAVPASAELGYGSETIPVPLVPGQTSYELTLKGLRKYLLTMPGVDPVRVDVAGEEVRFDIP